MRSFLQNTLPSLADDWWSRHVVGTLSFQQQRMVEEKKISDLYGLDLAALLRVLDHNWSELSFKASLPRYARNYVKEMQTIRNRWAHASSEAASDDDTYRELDTLQRLLEAIKADDTLIDRVRTLKKSCHQTPNSTPPDDQPPSPPSTSDTEFKKGDVVVPRANPSLTGAVIDVVPGGAEDRYMVFHDGSVVTYYASQLARQEQAKQTQEIVSLEKFHTSLTALQLRHPGVANPPCTRRG